MTDHVTSTVRRVSAFIGMVAVALVAGAPGPRAAAATPADPTETLRRAVTALSAALGVIAGWVGDLVATTAAFVGPTDPGRLVAVLVAPGLVALAVILLVVVWPLTAGSTTPSPRTRREERRPAPIVPLVTADRREPVRRAAA